MKCILGEIIAEPSPVESMFSLGKRPFLGTTSMSAVSAHLASVAANAGEGKRVLDPFCGTGSLLLSSAYLGAEVFGSDIDATSVGLDLDKAEETNLTYFKNQNFRRYGAMKGFDQSNKTIIDNFIYYGLEDQVRLLAGCDVQSWLNAYLHPDTPQMRHVYGEDGLVALPLTPFDAICCDPPYSRREKAHNLELSPPNMPELAAAAPHMNSSNMGNPHQVLSTLFQLARVSLKPGGRLVFWYPSSAFLSESEIREQLQKLEATAHSELQEVSCGFDKNNILNLKLLRVTAEKLHNKLWRWLAVYETFK